MIIAVRSEIDSRVLIYPMMRALWNHGSILVISRNEQLRRLIDDEDTNGFRDATIIIEHEGALDDILEEYGIAYNDYNFIILDNTAFTDYDVLFLPMGATSSTDFYEDVKLLTADDEEQRVFLVQFGRKGKPQNKPTQSKKPAGRQSPRQVQQGRDGITTVDEMYLGITEEAVEHEYDPAEKFRKKVDAVKEVKQRLSLAQASFPTFDDIERVEAEHLFYDVPNGLDNVFYDAFSNVLGIDLMAFRKELRIKDEGSSNFKSTKPGAE